MRSPFVIAVMVHVSDPAAVMDWYQRAFAGSTRATTADHDFEYLQLGNARIEIATADKKLSSGPSGTVVYWQVENIAASLAKFESPGAKLYPGSMNIENGKAMCQVQDPRGSASSCEGL